MNHKGFLCHGCKDQLQCPPWQGRIHSNAYVPSSLHQMLFIWRPEGDVEVIHEDPIPFREESFHVEAMMYLPHFNGFKRGTKPTIALDRPVMIAAREVGRLIIIKLGDDPIQTPDILKEINLGT